MALLRCIVYVGALALSAAQNTPIDKVINLIEGMKSDVENEGRSEAKSYGDFACFCKKTTKVKADSVKKENDNIDALSATIADKTESKAEDVAETSKRKDRQVDLSKKLDESNSQWEKDLAAYQVKEADYEMAISSLKGAIKSMKDSRPSAAVLLSIRQTVALAETMNMVVAPKHKATVSFLQGGPDREGYDYHSNDIIELLESLHTDFTAEKKELDTEHEKAKKAAADYAASLRKKMAANKVSIGKLAKSISKLDKELSQHRSDLVNSQTTLTDDEEYLKDLTARCEERANDYDQRSAMRNDEITALSTALKVLKDEVTPADKANVRAFIQKAGVAKLKVSPAAASVSPSKVTEKSISLLQEVLTTNNLRGASVLEGRKKSALALLSQEGQRLNSYALTSLAVQTAGDPFKKVKGLIQKLIERLLAESEAEATKKGFCDTELGKARKSRDFRFEEANDISADLASLEAKRDELTEEIKLLAGQIIDETSALKESTKDRQEEKDTNMETLKTAKDGLDAVSRALLVLKDFYKQAAKATAFVQASPVDEDTAGAGFSGSYGGNQSGSKAVLSLLETIQSDFDRTIRTTEADEEKAHREFVEFNAHAKSSLASKNTKKELDEQDLETTLTNLKTKTDDLRTAMDLLDSALKELEDLKPTCIDTGMSYSERVQKREEEMKALKNALCILDEDNVEKECK
jgi:hypothetical protein